MKTIIIAHNYSENSFAFMSYNLANYLADEGSRVVFISHKPYFDEVLNVKIGAGELTVYSWPSKKRPTRFVDALWFAKIYLKYRPSIIVCHFVSVNVLTIVSKLLSFGKVKTFPYYHTLMTQILLDYKQNYIKEKLLNMRKKLVYIFFSDTIICPSDLARSDLNTYFGITKSVTILNPMKDRFIDKIILSSDVIVISYLGRLDPAKGVVEMIKAFQFYVKKVPNTKILLNIAGSGKQKDEIIKMITDESKIKYFGELTYDRVDGYLSNSHFTIIPSKSDNLPTVGIESLMNKKPLLISNFTGLTEYLRDGEDCFTFDPNINDLIHLFDRVETNFNKYPDMSDNARHTYESKFTIDNYVFKMKRILNA